MTKPPIPRRFVKKLKKEIPLETPEDERTRRIRKDTAYKQMLEDPTFAGPR